MNYKTLFIALLLLTGSVASAQKQQPERKRKNSVEMMQMIAVVKPFEFYPPGTNFNKFQYNRYLGKYFFAGFNYISRYKEYSGAFVTTYGLHVGLQVLPIFIKNDDFNKNWEVNILFSVLNQYKTIYSAKNETTKSTMRQELARVGIARLLKNNFYITSYVGIWQDEGIYLGLRYKF